MDPIAYTVGTVIIVLVAVGVAFQYVLNHQHGFRNAVLIAFAIFAFARVAQAQHDTHFIDRTIAFVMDSSTARAEAPPVVLQKHVDRPVHHRHHSSGFIESLLGGGSGRHHARHDADDSGWQDESK